MKKLLNKYVFIIILIILLIPIFIAFNNYNSYNNYLNEFDKVGYVNTVFPRDNKLIKFQTLSYMQYELDNYIANMNKEIKEIDKIYNEIGVVSNSDYTNLSDELRDKTKLVNNYLHSLDSDFKLNHNKITFENTKKSLKELLTKNINDVKTLEKQDTNNLNVSLKLKINNLKKTDVDSLVLHELVDNIMLTKNLKDTLVNEWYTVDS